MIYNFFICLEVLALFFIFRFDTTPLFFSGLLISPSIFLSFIIQFYLNCQEHSERNASVDPIIFTAKGVFIIVSFATFLPCSLMLIITRQNLMLILLHDLGRLFFIVSAVIEKKVKTAGLLELFLQA
jgi:hypothetical protein